MRYIAVNDNVDTLKPDNDVAPFKNILNDMYAKDISRKTKTAKRQRALQGMYIGCTPPYGYKRHPQNRSKLIIDEEAAEVVREIFKLALEGRGIRQIRAVLAKKRILVPSAYKCLNGGTRFDRFLKGQGEDYKYLWRIPTIHNILADRVYAGDLESHKTEVASYKTKKRVPVSKDKRIVVENTHEPIVSREDFERIRELWAARCSPNRHNYDNLFRSILFCAECGHRLAMAYNTTAAGTLKVYYRCANHYENPDKCGKGTSIAFDDLYGQVRGKLKRLFGLLNDCEMSERLKNGMAENGGQKKAVAEKERIEKRMAALSKLIKKLYEDHIAGILDVDSYQSFLSDYQRERQELCGRLSVICAEIDKRGERDKGFEQLKAVAGEFLNCRTLTAVMLNKLIERIEVGRPRKENGKIK
ncbi:MAG: recombinase family protein [Clostridiales bacterium]|nr:recombinase family protein [Clostridiales bacterium]